MKILNLLFLILPFASLAQTLVVPSTRWSTQPWEARWVGPTENKSQYGVPQLQSLSKVQGSIPHWAGNLEVIFEKKGDGLSGKVILPKGITGKLVWNLKAMELREGENRIGL